MGADLCAQSPAARSLFERADGVLGFSLSGLCASGPEEELRQTINTQPALYVTSCAALAALQARKPVTPFAVAGHSVGEYAALYAAGAIEFEDGLRLVRRRAELMQEAAQQRPGAMAAVLGLDADVVARVVGEAASAGVVGVANYNCPGQIVISGEQAGVDAAAGLLKQAGAKRVMPLPVSGGFHSALMAEAGEALRPSLIQAGIRQARVPVVANVTAGYCSAASDLAANLAAQVSGSVRWAESMRLLLADGVDTFVELGSGDVLAGLLRRIDREARAVSVQDTASLDAAMLLIDEMEGAIREA